MRILLASAPVINREIKFNLQTLLEYMKAYRGKVELIVFGESILQGFECLCWDYEKDRSIGIALEDAPVRRIRAAAKEYRLAVSFGMIERRGDHLYSAQLTIGADGELVNLFHRVSVGWKDVSQTDEHYPTGLTPAQIVEYISREKADAAAKLCTPEEIVITADTMVFLDDQRLGKPQDEADALRMLTALQGRRHTVCTGVTVRQGDRVLTESEATGVVFRPAEESELRAYIATGEPMDKAGSYGVQGKGALLVERLEGDFFNVMGLPVLRLSRMLAQFGIKLL